MQASAACDLAVQARLTLRISARSVWSDQTWHLDGYRPGANRGDFSLSWGFYLSDDSRFDDPQWTDWREAAKLFLWSLKLRLQAVALCMTRQSFPSSRRCGC